MIDFVELFRFYKRTTIHKFDVGLPMLRFAAHIAWRAIVHDLSKYRWSEAKGFVATNAEMRRTDANTPAYKALCNDPRVKSCIEVHYSRNSHHPEYHALGIEQMSFLDEIEMAFDWCAASKRAHNGNAWEWCEKSRERFGHGEERRDIYRKAILFAKGGS